MQSQEDRPHSHHSARQIAHKAHISRSCVYDIIKTNLQMKYLKRCKARELTEANNLARHQRAKELLKEYPAHSGNFIWFSDEKLLTVAAPNNSQNDPIYAHSSVRKRNVSEARLLRTRPTFSKAVMVTVAVSSLGCTSIHFIEPGVKINGEYHRNSVLRQMLLPDIRYTSFNRTVHRLTALMLLWNL